MTDSERASLLEGARRKEMSSAGFPSRDAFVEWFGAVAPLLNFSPAYYDAIQASAARVLQSGLRGQEYTDLLSHMDCIIIQAITELKGGITPRRDLTDDDDPWWYLVSCTTKNKLKAASLILLIIALVAPLAYYAGTNSLIRLVVDSVSSQPEQKKE